MESLLTERSSKVFRAPPERINKNNRQSREDRIAYSSGQGKVGAVTPQNNEHVPMTGELVR